MANIIEGKILKTLPREKKNFVEINKDVRILMNQKKIERFRK